VIRASWLQARDGPPTGVDFSRFIRNWHGTARRLLGGLWLRCHRSRIQATGRSVWSLGIPADNSQLHTAGLSPREAFFRGRHRLLALREEELPPVRRGHGSEPCDEWVFTRRGIHSSGRERKSWDLQHREACARLAWQPSVQRLEVYWDGWWSEASATGREYQWLSWRRTVKKVHSINRSLNLILRAPDARPLSKGQWVPRDELPARLCSFPGVGFR
jgi:hypothetical protein